MRHANELIVEKLSNSDELRRLHLEDAVQTLFSKEYQVGLLMLRDLINATCGFETIGRELDKSPKSIMRMLTLESNPTVANLFAILNFLIHQEGGELDIKYAA